MKKITFFLIAMVALTVSCKKNFLDPKVVNVINTEAGTFADSARTIQFVNGIYNNIVWTNAANRFNGGGNLAGAVDEAVNRDQTTSNQANYINQATLTSVNVGAGSSTAIGNDRGYWLVYWTPIRAINIALRDIPASPLPQLLKNRLTGEARFLKAYYYFTLMKYYGGVPLIGNAVFDPESAPVLPRASFDATVKYITSECDSAANLLYNANQLVKDPVTGAQIFDGPGADNGRASKGACLALKARVLLYAASPLFNGGNTGTQNPELTGYTAFDKERWKLAADAADVVINSGQYALKVDNTTAPGYGFYLTFVTRPVQPTPEFIFSYMRAPNKSNETQYDPPSRGSSPSTYPYQELVDAFPMKNGKPITDPASGYDPANPYSNRDPRFDFTILHNESLRFLQSAGTQTKVFTYVNAALDGYNGGTLNTTTTGYYVMKTLDKNVTNAGSATSPRCDPLIRYAEMLLNEAEATNEYYGPTQKVYQLLGQIRNRAGIAAGLDGLYGIPAGLTLSDMRLVIQNERRIEMAFEDQRIWDIHRWKIGDQLMNKFQHGVQIVPKAGGGYTYTYFNANRTYWLPALYLFPISQYEIARNPLLMQNPGW